MPTSHFITSFCSIRNGQVNSNHSILFAETNPITPLDFFKNIYKHYQLDYAKFYKMDKLCKLAFLASELLVRNNPVTEKYPADQIAVIVCNSASSTDIDEEHQQTINNSSNYFPSPSNFVYTLPNILIAEIAIRNKITGENAFFIFDRFDTNFVSGYVNSLLDTGRASCCMVGWVDYYRENYHAFLYTVEKQSGILQFSHTPEALEKLFLHHA